MRDYGMGNARAKKTGQPKTKVRATISHHKKPDGISNEEWQRELRKLVVTDKNSEKRFTITNVGREEADLINISQTVFGDYSVKNNDNGNTYKVALRSRDPGANFCTCLDFKTNTLGTCKHIEAVLAQLLRRRQTAQLLAQPYRPAYSSLYVKYGATREVMLRIGTAHAKEFAAVAKNYFDASHRLISDRVDTIDRFLAEAAAISADFRCYPDTMDLLLQMREDAARRSHLSAFADRRGKGTDDSYFNQLLKARLYPYQKEGILFAARAGRSLIADEMGLGKTLQAIGLAEFLKKEFGIRRVMVVCPVSLKYQWKSEIEKFIKGDAQGRVQVVEGDAGERRAYYSTDCFYTIASYSVVGADLDAIQSFEPDLVILDEAQRIKNWDTRTAQEVKKIRSKYALVLTGTPIENKLEELYSIVQFIDPFALGPLHAFIEKHHLRDTSGKVVGYQHLHDIQRVLSSIVLRRTKAGVMQQLPGRTDKNLFVPMTDAQTEQHAEFADRVARLVRKWKRFGFLDETDRQKLLRALNCMRMVSDSTYILDQETRNDTKIAELMSILDGLFASGSEKAVAFSQWERMTRLVAAELQKRGVQFAYLHGGVKSDKRKGLLDEFRDNPSCKVFLSTDAGGVGLNLQSASLLVNIDLPWNPAVLEQRIGRIHRHGQKRSVNIINLISLDSIEHRMLDVLKFKSSLFSGVLDGGEDQVFMGESKFKRFMSSVEKVTDAGTTELPKPVTDVEIKDTSEESVVRASQSDDVHAVTRTIFNAFTNLFSSPRKIENLLSSFIQTDEKTGTRRIVIPAEVERAALQAFDTITLLLRRKN